MKKLLLSTLVISPLVLLSHTAEVQAEQNVGERETEAVIKFKANDEPTKPVDPLSPENELTPLNPFNPETPVKPGANGPLSLDYASDFNFGEQKISSRDQRYYAYPQLSQEASGEHKTVPLYAQVTDNRGTEQGWTLYVKQNGSLKANEQNQLLGSEIIFHTGQLASVSTSKILTTVADELVLSTANQKVMAAEKGEGAGTWVYRMGNEEMTLMEKGVELFVPGKITKLKDLTYKTNLTWTLSTVPQVEETTEEK